MCGVNENPTRARVRRTNAATVAAFIGCPTRPAHKFTNT